MNDRMGSETAYHLGVLAVETSVTGAGGMVQKLSCMQLGLISGTI